MMGVIFATDMSRHMNDLKEINKLLEIDVDSVGGLRQLIAEQVENNLDLQNDSTPLIK